MVSDSIYTATLLSTAAQQVTSWAGGETTQIAIQPAGVNFRDMRFDWRVSRASVLADGPFTKFPEYDRILLLLSGHGILIEHEGRERQLLDKPLMPYPFSGDWETRGSLLSGPITDFNVIFARGRVTATIDPYELTSAGDIATIALRAGVHLVYCAFGSADVIYAKGDANYPLKEGEALLMSGEQLNPVRRNDMLSIVANRPDTVLIDVQMDRIVT